MTPRALVALCLVSAAAAGPLLGKVMSRPDASPNDETERQLQADLAELEARKARARGDVLEPPPPPPDDGKHPRRGSRRADSELPSPRSDTPSGSASEIEERISVLADVLPQARDDRPMAAQPPYAMSVISHPQYANLGLAAPSSLLDADAISLAEINATLAARTEACGLVLAGYESLGQRPPPDFRSEPLPWLQERAANLTVKGPLLRELCALDAALGRKRVDWDLPTLSEESLRERVAKREEQVRSRREKREKDELLGKVEATLWKLGEEVPVSIGALNVTELRVLHKKLRRKLGES